MMSAQPIRVLSTDVANKIAAGEVVERPASVVKELLENAIDAKAKNIEIEVRAGGRDYIRVTDDGHGISQEQLPLAFLRHATSKIASAEDLTQIASLGFRGEALASIASCAEVEVISRTAETEEAARLVIKGGHSEPVTSWGAPPGTTIVVRNLFYNTPARLKFLKQPATERRHSTQYVSHMALAHPEIAFHLIGDHDTILRTPGTSDLLTAFGAVHGTALARRMIPVDWESASIRISGYVSPPDEVKSNRLSQAVFVNGRWVQNRLLYSAVEKAYDTMLAVRRFPVVALHLEIDPSLVDINVHPAKTEVRFHNDSEIFRHILRAVRAGLAGANLMPRAKEWSTERADDHQREQVRAYQLFPEQRAPMIREAGSEVAASYHDDSYDQTRPAGLEIELESLHDQPDLLEHMRAPLVEQEIPKEAEAVRDFLSWAEPMGQILNMFIAVASPYGLWIIDQHIAHERILYEELLARHNDALAQMLLAPVTLTFSPAEATLVESRIEELRAMGFALEEFGTTTYMLRTTPLQIKGATHPRAWAELLIELATAHEEGDSPLRVRSAAMIACKAAIKAGRRLDPQAQRSLLAQLASVANPFACPHGRPIMIAIDRQELERRFGRR